MSNMSDYTGPISLGITHQRTIPVGPTRQFKKISEALRGVSRRHVYWSGTPVGGFQTPVIINLDSGFVLDEQIILSGVDLGWITIKASAPVSVTASAITSNVGGTYLPVFCAFNNSVLPNLEGTFNLSPAGGGLGNLVGVFLGINSRVALTDFNINGCNSHAFYSTTGSLLTGQNIGADSCLSGLVCDGGVIIAPLSSVSNMSDSGIIAKTGTILADASNFSNINGDGVWVINGGTVSCQNTTFNQIGGIGVRAAGASSVNAINSVLTNIHGIRGMSVEGASNVNADGSSVTTTAGDAFYSAGSRMTVTGTTSSVPGGKFDYMVQGGGIIGGTGFLGGVNVNTALNTTTADGIIFSW